MINQGFKEEFIKLSKEKKINNPIYKKYLTGFAGGATSSLLLAPLDTIKDVHKGANAPEVGKNVWETTKNLYRAGKKSAKTQPGTWYHGVKRFYRGAPLSAAKVGLGLGISLGTAAAIENAINKVKNENK
jgi:hypothetical protein